MNTVVVCYLLGSVIGALIFIGIGSHVCTKHKEHRELEYDLLGIRNNQPQREDL